MGEIYRQSLTEIHRQRMHDVDQLISFRKTDTSLYSDLLKDVKMLRRFEFEARRRLNSCTPLLCLPPEIITLIARILVDEWLPTVLHCTNVYRYDHSSIGWLALTHVCRALRSTLLSDCSLWASIVQTFSGEAQSVILSRARTFPLVLRVDGRQCLHTAEQVRFMMNNLFQAREISVRDHFARRTATTVNRWPLGPAALAGQELPHLEKLELFLIPDRDAGLHWMLVSGDAFELEPMIAPCLKSLSLFNFYVPFNGNSLTILKLSNAGDLTLPTPPQFLSILRSCGKLQTLDLTCWIPELQPADEPTVSFPSLTAITIRDEASQMLAFLSHITLPHSTLISLALRGVPRGVESGSVASYLDAIQCRISPKITLPIHTAGITFTETSLDLTFLYSPSEPSQTLDRKLGLHRPYCTRLFLDPSLSAQQGQQMVLIAGAGTILPSSILLSTDTFSRTIEHYALAANLRLLHVELPTGTSLARDAWLALLEPLVHLHTLRVPRLGMSTLLPLLVVPSASSPPSLPALRNFSVEILDLRHQGEPNAPVEPSRRTAALCDMLLSRCAAGVGLERLRIGKLLCSTDEIARGVILPRLRALVPRVEWTGDGSICEDEE